MRFASLSDMQRALNAAIALITEHFKLSQANVDLLKLEADESFENKRRIIALGALLKDCPTCGHPMR